jgi:hypothetical protein
MLYERAHVNKAAGEAGGGLRARAGGLAAAGCDKQDWSLRIRPERWGSRITAVLAPMNRPGEVEPPASRPPTAASLPPVLDVCDPMHPWLDGLQC